MKDHATVCRSVEAQYFQLNAPAINDKDIQKITFKLLPDISNDDRPIDPLVFWIRITGFTDGRKSFQRGQWNAGDQGIPMLYSTEYAYIEKKDGTRIQAGHAIHLSSKKDPDQPGVALRDKVVDLNSDEIQLSNKHGWSLYGSVYIKFNTPPPLPLSQWKLHLGRIELGDKTVEIPVQSLCFNKGFSTTRWGFGLP